jgi:hypothetical protein
MKKRTNKTKSSTKQNVKRNARYVTDARAIPGLGAAYRGHTKNKNEREKKISSSSYHHHKLYPHARPSSAKKMSISAEPPSHSTLI